MRTALSAVLSFAFCLFTFAFSSLSRLLREDVLVYALRVADDDELKVLHVGVGDALHVCGRDGAQAVEEDGGAAPAAADQLVLREFAGLRGEIGRASCRERG